MEWGPASGVGSVGSGSRIGAVDRRRRGGYRLDGLPESAQPLLEAHGSISPMVSVAWATRMKSMNFAKELCWWPLEMTLEDPSWL